MRKLLCLPISNITCGNHTVDSLIDSIYSDIDQGEKDDQYFLDRNILTCTNSDVTDLNARLLERFPGEKHVMLSADSVELEDEGMNEHQPYPVDYLNSLVSSSLRLAHLELKVGCPVMLLRNLDASKGLMEIRQRVLKCRIISGDQRFAGNVVFISRITLAPSAEGLPLPL